MTPVDNLRLQTRIGLRLRPVRRCGRVAEGGGLLMRLLPSLGVSLSGVSPLFAEVSTSAQTLISGRIPAYPRVSGANFGANAG